VYNFERIKIDINDDLIYLNKSDIENIGYGE
jgi:hypothetical protein